MATAGAGTATGQGGDSHSGADTGMANAEYVMIEPVSLADRIARLAANPQPAATTQDVSLLACWTQQTFLIVAFRSRTLPNPNQPVGIICDVTQLSSSDIDTTAYEFFAFEMVKSHHYPHTFSSDGDAVHWRLAQSTQLPVELENLLSTLSTVRDIGEFVNREISIKTSVTVAFVATFILAGCGSATDRAEISAYALSSPSDSPVKTKYEYAASEVEAAVDGTPVQLRPFPFSVGSKGSRLPVTSVLGDGCRANGADVRGQFVVVRRGGCTFEQKYDVARRVGASGLIITSTDPLPDGRWQTPPIDLTAIPMLVTDEPNSARLLAEGKTVTVKFDADVKQTPAD